jgi:hypothetical protein
MRMALLVGRKQQAQFPTVLLPALVCQRMALRRRRKRP